MRDGLNMQVADPLTLYRQPENLFVAGFIGSPPMNLLKGKVQRRDDGLFFAEAGEKNALTLPLKNRPEPLASKCIDKNVVFGIRPQHKSIIPLEDRMRFGGAKEYTITITKTTADNPN
jgi:multiple sugar transport system ATP-binding protein